MKNKKPHLVALTFLIINIINIGCSDEPVLLNQNYSIKGVVTSAEQDSIIDSVMVGFKNPGIPDSMIYISDSLVIENTDWINYQTLTKNGLFSFSFQYEEDFPVNLNDMFAYKPGEKLWVYTSWVDTIHHILDNSDSIKIRLKVNDCYRMPDWSEITLYDHLFISFPKNYGCLEGTWQGLDTWGFNKTRDDEQVIFDYELGMVPIQPQEFTFLPITAQYGYSDRVDFFVGGDSAAFYYKNQAYPFLDKKGIVLIKNEERTKYRETVNVFFEVEALAEVIQILDTIRYK
jgi:hypothetical protein